MVDPKTAADLRMTYNLAGVVQTAPVVDKRTVVGPVSYVVGGIPIDLSAVYSQLLAVRVLRVYTAGGTGASLIATVSESGANTFANRKFLIMLWNARPGITPAGTVSAPTISLANGAPTNVAITAPSGNGQALAAGLTGGAGSATGLTGVQAPTFTGTLIGAGGLSERGAGNDLSTFTVEYEVVAVV